MNMMLVLLINITLSMILISVAFWLPHLNTYTEKANPYECGFDPMSSACSEHCSIKTEPWVQCDDQEEPMSPMQLLAAPII